LLYSQLPTSLNHAPTDYSGPHYQDQIFQKVKEKLQLVFMKNNPQRVFDNPGFDEAAAGYKNSK
jgi:hypothetical protein